MDLAADTTEATMADTTEATVDAGTEPTVVDKVSPSKPLDAPTDPGPSTSQPTEEQPPDARFECNICLDSAKDAVISMCGHLFCWPCIHQWLETRPSRQTCPVCKSAIAQDKLIPLYGRGGDNVDPRTKVPPRPQGQRSEPQNTGFPGFAWGGGGGDGWGGGAGGIQFSFGIGAFPFTMFASTLNFGEQRPHAPAAGTREYQEEQFISKLFIGIAIVFMVWLILA